MCSHRCFMGRRMLSLVIGHKLIWNPELGLHTSLCLPFVARHLTLHTMMADACRCLPFVTRHITLDLVGNLHVAIAVTQIFRPTTSSSSF